MLSGDTDAAGLGHPLCVLPGDFGGLHVKTTEGETIYPSYHSRMGRASDKAGSLGPGGQCSSTGWPCLSPDSVPKCTPTMGATAVRGGHRDGN